MHKIICGLSGFIFLLFLQLANYCNATDSLANSAHFDPPQLNEHLSKIIIKSAELSQRIV